MFSWFRKPAINSEVRATESTISPTEKAMLARANTTVWQAMSEVGLKPEDAGDISGWEKKEDEKTRGTSWHKEFTTPTGTLSLEVKEMPISMEQQVTPSTLPKFEEMITMVWERQPGQDSSPFNTEIMRISTSKFTSALGTKHSETAINIKEQGVDGTIVLKSGEKVRFEPRTIGALEKIEAAARRLSGDGPNSRTFSSADLKTTILDLGDKYQKDPWGLAGNLLSTINSGISISSLHRSNRSLQEIVDSVEVPETTATKFRLDLSHYLSKVIPNMWLHEAPSGTKTDTYATAALIERTVDNLGLPDEVREKLLEKDNPIFEIDEEMVQKELEELKAAGSTQENLPYYLRSVTQWENEHLSPSLKKKILDEVKRGNDPELWNWRQLADIDASRIGLPGNSGLRKDIVVNGIRLSIGAHALVGGFRGGVSMRTYSCDLPKTVENILFSKISFIETKTFGSNKRYLVTTGLLGDNIVIECEQGKQPRFLNSTGSLGHFLDINGHPLTYESMENFVIDRIKPLLQNSQ